MKQLIMLIIIWAGLILCKTIIPPDIHYCVGLALGILTTLWLVLDDKEEDK